MNCAECDSIFLVLVKCHLTEYQDLSLHTDTFFTSNNLIFIVTYRQVFIIHIHNYVNQHFHDNIIFFRGISISRQFVYYRFVFNNFFCNMYFHDRNNRM